MRPCINSPALDDDNLSIVIYFLYYQVGMHKTVEVEDSGRGIAA
jgi:hypothetical protein